MTSPERSRVDREIDAALLAGARRSHRLGEEHRHLIAALSRASRGGKRFRPALLLAVHDALGGEQPEAASRLGAALELLHTAFVIHDDVIDEDDVRRGAPNVSGTFVDAARARGAAEGSARRSAVAAGVLAGDLALISAMRLVADCGAPAPTTRRLLVMIEDAAHAAAAGELLDVQLELGMGARPASFEDALLLAELKTASYSFQLPLQAGAALAEADPETIEALGEVGRLLGIGFQLVDDLLGVYGDPRETGKSNTSDLREGKWTTLTAYARSTPTWPSLRPLLGNPGLDEDSAARARELLTACGARVAVRDLACRYLDDGLIAAHHAAIPTDIAGSLSALIGSIRTSAHYPANAGSAEVRA